MGSRHLTTSCERARARLSMKLDGRLSQLELRMVDAHLERCADCRSFEAEVTAFTAELRSARPESPSRPITVYRPARAQSRLLRRLAPVSVASALVVGALGLAGLTEPPGLNEPGASPDLFQATWQPEQEQAQLAPRVRTPPRLGETHGLLQTS